MQKITHEEIGALADRALDAGQELEAGILYALAGNMPFPTQLILMFEAATEISKQTLIEIENAKARQQ